MLFSASVEICFILVLLKSFVPSGKTDKSIRTIDNRFEQETYYNDLIRINDYNEKSGNSKIPERTGSHQAKHTCNTVKSIPANLRDELKLSYFYQKYTDAYGIPILGSNKVSANAIKRACYVLRFFLAEREDVRSAFHRKNLRIVVISSSENLLSVPELNYLGNKWIAIRGLSATKRLPLVAIGEENVLCNSLNEKFKKEDLLLHQLAYSMQTLNALDARIENRLNMLYANAIQSEAWTETFALQDPKEYLANGIELYFNTTYKSTKEIVNDIHSLRTHDIQLYVFIRELFFCENTYINKCKSNKDSEIMQPLRVGQSCEAEAVSGLSRLSNLALTLQTTTRITTQMPTTSTTRRTSSTTPTTTTTTATTRTTTTTATTTSTTTTTTTIQTPRPTTTTTSTSIRTTQSTIKSDCKDLNENCALWFSKGECQRNPQFMNFECKSSCGLCDPNRMTTKSRLIASSNTNNERDFKVYENFCKDEFAYCPVFALRGDCKTNPHHMLDKCKRSCNLCGDLVNEKDRIQPTSSRNPIVFRRTLPFTTPREVPLDPSRSFTSMRTTLNSRRPTAVLFTQKITTATTTGADLKGCEDSVGHCPDLAGRGDCVTNPETMRFYCPRSCKMC